MWSAALLTTKSLAPFFCPLLFQLPHRKLKYRLFVYKMLYCLLSRIFFIFFLSPSRFITNTPASNFIKSDVTDISANRSIYQKNFNSRLLENINKKPIHIRRYIELYYLFIKKREFIIK